MRSPIDFPRLATKVLESWSRRPDRRPLVIRGARQVGKSHLVRSFASRAGFELVELDLELQSSAASLFEVDSPQKVLRNLEGRTGRRITPGRSLLFLDEIQAVPRAFMMLRYFFEQTPELHVVAAGSLLELHLGEQVSSVPVGRVDFLELSPMTFEEYLLACDNEPLFGLLISWRTGDDLADGLHLDLMDRFREYLVVGGMPGVIRAWRQTGSLMEAARVQRGILRSFEDDFGKYRNRADVARLRKVFARVPGLVGSVVKYSHIDPDDRAAPLAEALDLLCRARVAIKVNRSACNGVPLAAEEDTRRFKLLGLDAGLLSSAWGLEPASLAQTRELARIRSGAVAEQVVGTHLIASLAPDASPRLHYWDRTARSSQAEVDYVVEVGPEILPVEVKAGSSGSLRSLHVFIREKRLEAAIRLNSEKPSLLDVDHGLADGSRARFRLLSLPLYLAGQLRRLAGELLDVLRQPRS